VYEGQEGRSAAKARMSCQREARLGGRNASPQSSYLVNHKKKPIAKKFHGGGFSLVRFFYPHKRNEHWGAGAGIAPRFCFLSRGLQVSIRSMLSANYFFRNTKKNDTGP